jgi:hypothetical protein
VKIRKSALKPGTEKPWRAFEVLVATIEERLAPMGATVRSPDRIRDLDTQRFREVDASIRFNVGSANVLITIECRRRKATADVTWIEQLVQKRAKLGASKTIAVSESGFSEEAAITAARNGIELRVLREITGADIDAWLDEDEITHIYRCVESIKCEATVATGEIYHCDGLEDRFAHPMVSGDFPAAVFVQFLEMKEPETFWRIPTDGRVTELVFELDALNPDLIPAPLGEARRSGHLELVLGGERLPVEKIRLVVEVKYVSDTLSANEGRHFVYGSPDGATSALSQYAAEVFELPAQYELHRDAPQGEPTAVARFPNGTVIEAANIRPKLMDMQAVDTESLHLLPITIKIEGGEPANGCLLHPKSEMFPPGSFPDEFDRENFVFVEAEFLLKIRAKGMGDASVDIPETFLLFFPRQVVEYIDIMPAIHHVAHMRTNARGRGVPPAEMP